MAKAPFPAADLPHFRAAVQLLETASTQLALFQDLFDDAGDTARKSPEETQRAAAFILDLLERATGELFSVDEGSRGPSWRLASGLLDELWVAFGTVATVCASLANGTFPDGRQVIGCPVAYAMKGAGRIVQKVLAKLKRELGAAPSRKILARRATPEVRAAA